MGHQKYIMKIWGKLAHILVDISPEVFGPYITNEDGKYVIHLELLKSLHGMLIASLLVYRKLIKDMESIGFRVNNYDLCVVNNMLCDKQMIINWHVDNLKVSHDDMDIVESWNKCNKETYEDITRIKPSRWKIHNYLAITLDYTTCREVKFYTKEYIDKVIKEFPYME